jgi:hypothetical protein
VRRQRRGRRGVLRGRKVKEAERVVFRDALLTWNGILGGIERGLLIEEQGFANARSV